MGKIIKFKRELWIGILGIIAILTVYLLINFFKGIDIFSDGNRYYVKFSNIGEIVNASPVYINGYKVGHVSNVIYDFDDAKEVCVELTVDNRLKVPYDSKAIISSGLIFPLNICVGLVVACTMYAFYTLFRKGGF